MALRQRRWAKKTKRRLLLKHGAKCAECGAEPSIATPWVRLTLDIVVPCDHGKHHDYEWSWRVSFYNQQDKAGNLQVLCLQCNSRKGHRDRAHYHGAN